MSKATKLKKVGFWYNFPTLQVIETLKTITSNHKALKQVSIRVVFDFEEINSYWHCLDGALVQLWELHQIHVKIVLYGQRNGIQDFEAIHEHIEHLLPEMTKRDKIQLSHGGKCYSPLDNGLVSSDV